MRAMKGRLAGGLLLAATLLPVTGCGTAAKQAFYELRGAKGTIEFIHELPGEQLDRYGSVRFEPATSDIGVVLCPPGLRARYDECTRELSEELRELFPGGEPTLTILTEILFFKSKGLLGDASFLSRVRFKEQEQLVGDALVVVGSKSFRKGGTDAMAETGVRTIGKFLRSGKRPDE